MKLEIFLFSVCLLVTQVVSKCPEGCICNSDYVKCVRSYLKTVPSDLSSDVRVLDLDVNEIRELTRNSFSTTPDLEILLLDYNLITTLPNGIFENIPKLRVLHLSRNKIDTIEPEAFKNLENLQQLYLHYNNIAHLDAGVFADLKNLQQVFLHYNTLIHVQTSVFESLPSVKNLRLNGNPLNCDCEIFWLVDLFHGRDDVHVSGICNSPKSLRNVPITEIKGEDFAKCATPRIIVQPNDVEVPKSGLISVTLKCKARGYPKPQISWKKDGQKIQSKNDKYELTSDGLVIKSVSDADLGKYQCVASNKAGSIDSTVAQLKHALGSASASVLTVNATASDKNAIHGTVSPDKKIIGERKNLEISCSVTTNQDINLVWLKNNVTFSKSSVSSKRVNNETVVSILNLTDTRIGDSGTYQCVLASRPSIIFGSSEITIEAAPRIIKATEFLILGNKSNIAELRCIVIGYPTPEITWSKNGPITSGGRFSLQEKNTLLKIENAAEKDSGVYSCKAKNSIGSAEEQITLKIKNQDSRIPEIIQKPFDISIPKLSDVSLPCKTDGNPQPKIQWLKDDKPLIADNLKLRILNNGTLRIFNVGSTDSGVYKCVASNSLGNDSASGTLTVFLDAEFSSIIDDDFIRKVVENVTLKYEQAVKKTMERIISQSQSDQSPGFLRKVIRYPDEFARNISKCREIFFLAVDLTEANVRQHFNLPKAFEVRREGLFTPAQLNLIKKLSGCEAAIRIANCSANIEFHSKYPSLDGTCNNLKHPLWGASYTPFRRLLKPIYSNGIDTPIAWNDNLRYNGFPRPSPRLVSASLIRTYTITPDTEITHLVMQWGQFMDHDWDHAPPSAITESYEDNTPCSSTCEYKEPCFAIRIPANDSIHPKKSCFEFIRSTSILPINDDDNVNDLPYREQLNQPTAYTDASMVYGFNKERSDKLRDLEPNVGLLKTGENNYLPNFKHNNFTVENDCKVGTLPNDTRPQPGCFFAGDVRVNEMVGLLTMHTIWFREHNRLAKELKKINPHWDGDQIFHEARKILAAELQHISYAHWLKHIVGTGGMKKMDVYRGYDENMQVAIANVFATAALRVGHTIINPTLVRLGSDYKPIPQGNLPLSKSFFAPWRLIEEGGVDPVMRGFYATPAKRKYPEQNLNEQIIDHLFENRTGGTMDLAALNIQRSRDHGLPGYAAYRKFCNLSEPQNFDDLKSDISSDSVRNKLKELYGHPGNVDVWVGGILEDQKEGAIVGPLFQCLITEQFDKLRHGDRFYYENPTMFTEAQRSAIKKVTLARVLCDNGDNITTITRDVFILPSLQKYVPCSEIPKLDLIPWKASKA